MKNWRQSRASARECAEILQVWYNKISILSVSYWHYLCWGCVYLCVFGVCIYLNSLSVNMIDSQLLEEDDKTHFSLLPSLFLAVFIFLSILFLSPSPPRLLRGLLHQCWQLLFITVVKLWKNTVWCFLSAAGGIKKGLIPDKHPRLQSENSGYALYTSWKPCVFSCLNSFYKVFPGQTAGGCNTLGYLSAVEAGQVKQNRYLFWRKKKHPFALAEFSF